jgi:TRAP-type uncharacterized transport system substrate-binding protein
MRRRWGSWVLLLLGLAAMALAVSTLVPETPQSVRRITITAGPFGTTRALVGRAIAAAVTARGGNAELVATEHATAAVDRVDDGSIDFALVPEAFPGDHRANIREVTPLYIEALHLLVKPELADAASQGLAALKGRTVNIGPPGSANAGLASSVLGFAGVEPGPGGYVPSDADVPTLARLIAARDRAALPDAVMHLATLPSEIAVHLIRDLDYALVALPFTDAFRLNALIASKPATDMPGDVERRVVVDVVIPAFTYQTEPAVPPTPLHTVGARLLLIANDAVSPDTVQQVLEALFSAQLAHVAYPPLDRGLLSLPPHLPRHEGTLQYLRRGQPYITQDTVDTLSSSFSVVGALAGGLLFLWQWWRQRQQAERDEKFGSHLLRMADVERRMTALELSATLELEPLVELQRELLTLKSNALDEYAAGELGGQAALSSLLEPLNATRDHIGDLILHVRGLLEEQAQAEGRSATAVWTAAIDKPDTD